jgi:hypothetical protein
LPLTSKTAHDATAQVTIVTAIGVSLCYGSGMKTTYDPPPAPLSPVGRLIHGAVETLLGFLLALLARPR